MHINSINEIKIGSIVKTYSKRTPDIWWMLEVYEIKHSPINGSTYYVSHLIATSLNITTNYPLGRVYNVTSDWFSYYNVMEVLNNHLIR